MIATETSRERLAAHGEPAELRRLARHEAIVVRAALALNLRAPDDVDALLSHDPDDRVRALVLTWLAIVS